MLWPVFFIENPNYGKIFKVPLYIVLKGSKIFSPPSAPKNTLYTLYFALEVKQQQQNGGGEAAQMRGRCLECLAEAEQRRHPPWKGHTKAQGSANKAS